MSHGNAGEGPAPEARSAEDANAPGIVTPIGELPPDAVISESGLAKIFGRHPASIKRAVAAGHLPPPIRLFGAPVWTVRSIREHLQARLEKAKSEARQKERKISELST